MNKPSSKTPKTLVQLATAKPEESDVLDLRRRAHDFPGTKFLLQWTDERSKQFFLALVSKVHADSEWRLFSGAGLSSKQLWCTSTEDIAKVFRMVCDTCGAEANMTADSLSERLMRENADPTRRTHTLLPQIPTGDKAGFRTTFTGMTALATPPLTPQTSQIAPAQPPQTMPLQTSQSMPAGRSHLTGDLAHVPAPQVVQSMSMYKMTGRLTVSQGQGTAEIFFENGEPVHASTSSSAGDEAIFEILSWTEGLFAFENKIMTQERTVTDRMDSLLLRGVELLDYEASLKKTGCSADSVLKRRDTGLSEEQFEKVATSGMPIDIDLQKRLYLEVDDYTSVEEIRRTLNLPRSTWMALLWSLFKLNLIEISTNPPPGKRRQVARARPIDGQLLQSVQMSLHKGDTGVYSQPAFLFMLNEAFRHTSRNNEALSLLQISIRINRKGILSSREPLPQHAVSEVIRRIHSCKGEFDFLGHWEPNDLALAMPYTRLANAAQQTERIVQAILSEPGIPFVNMSTVSIAAGVASLPEDCGTLADLIGASEEAREAALVANVAWKHFSNI